MAMAGWAGLAACLTMVFHGMRAVMDVGGYCAEGGPYVIAQSCPEGSTAALLLGVFGGLAFGFVASVGGFRVGGIWAATPILAWAALFGSLGWNFMEYGLFSPPEGEIVWGWLIPGLMFWAMAAFPLLGLLPPIRDAVGLRAPASRPGGGRRPDSTPLPGPGQPVRATPAARSRAPAVTAASPMVSADGRTITYQQTVIEGELPDEVREQLEAMAGQVAAVTADGTAHENREELARIAADFGAVIGSAMADVPVDPEARVEVGADAGAGAAGAGDRDPAFTEGTQALLDRLERLADMRDRDLLGPDEYETAKAAVMAELEGRS
jgi:hypothetical protein